jgi:hypothetical protein
VTLDGSASIDLDGDDLHYTWTGPFAEGGGTVTGQTAVVTLPLGEHTVVLVVEDGQVDSPPDTVEIVVRDSTPPDLVAHVTPDVLWPPDHRMRAIGALVEASDVCSGSTGWVLSSIVSSQADDAPGDDDGSTIDDIQGAEIGTPDREFLLRAERSVKASVGRYYTATFTATDPAGNTAELATTVEVPLEAERGEDSDSDGEP